MVYCTHCANYCPYIKDPDKGYICCGTCGKVLDQEIYTDEPTFVKDGSGQSRMAGTVLTSIESGSSLSHERTLMKGRDEIWQIVTSLHVGGGDTIIDMAHKIYTLAVDHNFTRGRRTTQVAAACLYIASGKNIEDFLAKADEEQPSHKSGEVLCKHKDKDAEHLAHGLCEKCYNKFIKMSGGLEGGADPPAFQQAEKQRLEAAKKAEEAAAIKEAALGESNCEIQNSDVEDNMICPMKEQAAKEALAAELAARGVRVGGGQPKKRRRNEDTKNLSPAETPAEATYNMLKQKGLGSKINIEAVGGLYDTKDEDGEADEKGDMGFDGEYTQDIGDGETFEGGYDYADYNNNGYGGAGDYTDHDDF